MVYKGNLFNISKEQREKYYSFSVSGSLPNGTRLFIKLFHIGILKKTTIIFEGDAKQMFVDGLNEGFSCIGRMEFNLNPIKNWIQNKDKKEQYGRTKKLCINMISI